MKKKIFPVLSVLIGIILFIGLMFAVGIGEVIQSFSKINLWYLVLYLGVTFCIFFGFVLRWWIILRVFKCRVPLFKLFLYRAAGYAVSYITPFAKMGGEPVRTYFLSKEHVRFSQAVSSVVIDKMLELTANILFTGIGIIVVALSFTLPSHSVGVVIWGLVLSIAFLAIFYYRLMLGRGFFTSLIDTFHLERLHLVRVNRWRIRDAEKRITEFFNHHRKQFAICMLISLGLWILTFLEYNVLTWVFGYHFSFPMIFAVVVMIGISFMFPIPAALGTQEGGQVTLFSIISAGGKLGFVISLITRVKDILWTAVGVIYMYHKGMKKLIRKEFRKKKDKIKWNF